MEQITTITFFKYSGLWNKVWAFNMMQFAHAQLAKAKGQVFYKLMGSGKGSGFNPRPDWSIYSLLQVWEDEASALAFLEQSDLMEAYKKHTQEHWTLFLKNIKAHGLWSGGNPFEVSQDLDSENPHLAIITRATIKTRKLLTFWNYVPTSERPIANNPGLIYTKGIGEVPVIQMATFSLWKNWESVKQFAYESAEHQEAIRKTRKLDWYKEELFARFQPYRSVGTWENVPRLDF
ncbi:MAG: DUF3291 domain-containing protein [Bacteroidota bacterium]